jgi:ABC-2 type transport system ATP-binding protein
MITGLIEPSDGEILFRGEPIRRNRIFHRQRLGYVPEEPHLYTHVTGLEYLEMVGELRCLPSRSTARKIQELLRLFGLFPERYTSISAYSKGMRQKILISAALLHNLELVVLDEPFSGLDVSTSFILRDLVSDSRAKAKSSSSARLSSKLSSASVPASSFFTRAKWLPTIPSGT